QLQLDLQRQQPLLGTVVEVALQLAPLPRSGTRESRPRVGELAYRLLPRGAELRVLRREYHNRTSGLEELWILSELLVMDDRHRRLAVPLELRQRLAAPRIRKHRPVGPHPIAPTRTPQPKPQPRIPQRHPHHLLKLP